MKATSFAVCALIAFTACVAAMEGPRPGGTSPVDVADAGVQSAAKFVLQSANKNECNGLCANINKTGELKLVEVKSATSQVVAGILYNLELIFADEDGNQVPPRFTSPREARRMHRKSGR